MSEKRKRRSSSPDLLSADNHGKKWAFYREHAGKALKERLHPPKLHTKAKHVNFVTTRLVQYDVKKKRYTTLEDKQCVEIMGDLEFERVSSCIWDYYGKKDGYSKENYNLKVITGVNGPIVSNTVQLDNKRDLFVLFEQNARAQENSDRSKSSTLSTPYGFSRHRSLMAESGESPKGNEYRGSVFPKITPSAIMTAAKIVDNTCVAEEAKVKCFVRNNNEWAWTSDFPIKFTRGSEFASGSVRDAYDVRIVDYGELPVGQYVLKLWNARAVEARQDELGSTDHLGTLRDLTKRAVQCQIVAKAIGDAFEASVNDSFGTPMRYVKAYYVELSDGIGSLEPKIIGKFVKYLNNSMEEVLCRDEFGLKAEALAHFSLSYSNGETLLTDLQGSGGTLTDPEIATACRIDKSDNELNFGFGNLGIDSIDNFKSMHICNIYCQQAGLTVFK